MYYFITSNKNKINHTRLERDLVFDLHGGDTISMGEVYLAWGRYT